jgi:long-chain acyl-CoA synthetase
LISTGSEITFWQLREHVLRMAHALNRLGVTKAIASEFSCPPVLNFPIAYLAALSLGAIAVNINPLYTAEELRYMMTTTGNENALHLRRGLPVVVVPGQECGIQTSLVTSVKDYIKGAGVSTARSSGS